MLADGCGFKTDCKSCDLLLYSLVRSFLLFIKETKINIIWAEKQTNPVETRRIISISVCNCLLWLPPADIQKSSSSQTGSACIDIFMKTISNDSSRMRFSKIWYWKMKPLWNSTTKILIVTRYHSEKIPHCKRTHQEKENMQWSVNLETK